MTLSNGSTISFIDAIEILDSRGRPTVEAVVGLQSGAVGTAAVPSGASKGSGEAFELRDGDVKRYLGQGVLKAVSHVRDEIAAALKGRDVLDQEAIDKALVDLDGTSDKSRLGANALLAVSMASLRAASAHTAKPVYRLLGDAKACLLPMPMFNVLNGGAHARSSAFDFQEFMLVPIGAPRFGEAVRYAAETFQALGSLLASLGHSTAVGDEGGFAPRMMGGNETACEFIVRAIEKAGYRPGVDVAIALDPAATGFCKEGRYHLHRSGEQTLDSAGMIELFARWIAKFPILSIEDGLAENDWGGFAALTGRLGGRVQIVGDDIFVTNPRLIQRGIDERCANAALIKLNQIGTVTETIAAVRLCQGASWRTVVSHRSGETADPFIADFSVGVRAGQIKSGSLSRSERLSKYNRLLEIERELGDAAEFVNPYR